MKPLSLKRWVYLVLALASSGCTVIEPHPVACNSAIPNAAYTGPYFGADDHLTAVDLSRDLLCADKFKMTKYPKGFIGIYGSSRISEHNSQEDPQIRQANDHVYKEVKDFAYRWTQEYGKQLPILTGAGGGLMEAGARGAAEAGGPSIGYTTYYGPAREDGGKPELAFWTYVLPDGERKQLISDGLIFSSVGIREYAMFLHSAAIVIAPGGTGTEWEIFQILESIKSQQLGPKPVYLLGAKQPHWQSLYDRLADMAKRGTVNPGEVEKHFVHVETAAQLFERLKADMNLP